MILGQSAALGACLALDQNLSAQDVKYADLRPKLEAAQQVLSWNG